MSQEPFPPIPELVPHRPPMLLIDELVESSAKALTTRVRLTASSPFVESGRVPGVVILEYMAQSIAAFAGLALRARGQPPQLGFIISCREMLLEVDHLSVGEVVEVTVNEIWTDDKLGHFYCIALRADVIVAKAWLSVYQGELQAEAGG